MCYLIIAITWRSYPAEGDIRPLLTLIIFVGEALAHRKIFDVISLVIKHWNISSRVLLAFLLFFFFVSVYFVLQWWQTWTIKKGTSTKMLLELYITFPNCSLPYRRENVIQIITTPLFASKEQGWRSGESTRLPPLWPGFDFRTRRQMWIEFVSSLLCYEMFSPWLTGFPLSPKTNILIYSVVI